MKHLACYFLLLGLAACADYTGPDGARIYGPQVGPGASGSGLNYVLTYTIADFKPHYPGSREYLRHLAWEAVENNWYSGEYMVVFLDKTSSKQLLTERYSAQPDILFNVIHFIEER